MCLDERPCPAPTPRSIINKTHQIERSQQAHANAEKAPDHYTQQSFASSSYRIALRDNRGIGQL